MRHEFRRGVPFQQMPDCLTQTVHILVAIDLVGSRRTDQQINAELVSLVRLMGQRLVAVKPLGSVWGGMAGS